MEIFSNTFTATVEQYKKAYELWGLNKWDELYKYFVDNNLNKWDDIIWPPFNGAKSIFKTERGSQLIDKVFDRFQDTENLSGGFASPVLSSSHGVNDLVFTYDSRALAGRIKDGKYYIKFKMKNTLPPDLEFEYGETIPWFNLQGNAVQIKSSIKLQDLFNQGYIEIIEILKRNDGKWIRIK